MVNWLLTKKQIRQQRLALCIKQLQTSEACKTCELKEAYENEGKGIWNTVQCKESGCEVFSKLLGIGEALENLSRQKKEAQMASTLTAERYQTLKSKGKTDKQIMKEFGYHNQSFTKWKREQGLIKPSDDTPSPSKLLKEYEVCRNSNQSFSKKDKLLPKNEETVTKPQEVLTESDLKKIFNELFRLEKSEKSLKKERDELLQQVAQYEQTILDLEQTADSMRGNFEETLSKLDLLEHEFLAMTNSRMTENYQRSQQLNSLLMQEILALREAHDE